MHGKVRDLYKRFIFVLREYPGERKSLLDQIKQAFFLNHDIPVYMKGDDGQLEDSIELRKAVLKGRYYVREIRAMGALHKYRTLKKAYS